MAEKTLTTVSNMLKIFKDRLNKYILSVARSLQAKKIPTENLLKGMQWTNENDIIMTSRPTT